MKCCNCKNLGKLKDEDGEPYDWCEKVCDCPDAKMERNCRHFEIATHADKLRAMSDEELAAWLADHPVVSMYDGSNPQHKAWLDWLRQEAQP